MILGDVYYPQSLLGTYESELHPWLERIFAKSFAHVIDIGGGTGYYAAGLALRMPHARLTVFELTAGARAVIANVARLNGVTNRITLLAECTPGNLATTIVEGESTFVLIDVEGAEMALLDPEKIPPLRGATILVETHDILVPGCRDTITRRFAATHTIEELTSGERTLRDFPPALAPRWRRLFPGLALEAIRELRGGPQVFMLLTPCAS
jgi:predicted O-methyltransferase YrrM